ncbi:MAG TPA: hypothetical protein VFV38_13230 [Ktedonobacteraceae bacterium]|nr:hypothetical protein [Ktedonobacteraceae bacterium]
MSSPILPNIAPRAWKLPSLGSSHSAASRLRSPEITESSHIPASHERIPVIWIVPRRASRLPILVVGIFPYHASHLPILSIGIVPRRAFRRVGQDKGKLCLSIGGVLQANCPANPADWLHGMGPLS